MPRSCPRLHLAVAFSTVYPTAVCSDCSADEKRAQSGEEAVEGVVGGLGIASLLLRFRELEVGAFRISGTSIR